MLNQINYFLTNERNRKLLAIAGSVLTLMGLMVAGVADDPPLWPG